MEHLAEKLTAKEEKIVSEIDTKQFNKIEKNGPVLILGSEHEHPGSLFRDLFDEPMDQDIKWLKFVEKIKHDNNCVFVEYHLQNAEELMAQIVREPEPYYPVTYQKLSHDIDKWPVWEKAPWFKWVSEADGSVADLQSAYKLEITSLFAEKEKLENRIVELKKKMGESQVYLQDEFCLEEN